MKNKIIIIVLLVLCLIPSAVAYASYQQTQTAPVDEKTATKLTIVDINGKSFTFIREAEGDDASKMIAFFLQMNANASQIAALPDSLNSAKSFLVTISTNVRDEAYQYYFSPDPSINYFIAPGGAAYHIADGDAQQFITTVYAESIYKTSAMPTLTLSNTYSVTPDEAVWQYKNYTGEYVDADTSQMVFNQVENYELEGGLNLAFDIEPDYFNVKIADTVGNVLFNDAYANLSALNFTVNTSVTIDVAARWYEDPSRSFRGEMTYRFESLVTAPAEFYLGMESVERGGFVAVTGLNVTNPDRVEVTSDIPNGVSPTFYREGDYVVGLLPVDISVPAGLYTLTFTYGGSTQVSSLYVEDKTVGVSQISVTDSVLSTYRTAETVAEFGKIAEELMGTSVDHRLFSGSFLEGAPEGAQLLRGFGREIVINGDETNTYRNNGVDYSAPWGSSVYAANAGQVVFAGTLSYTGNLIVIDHGLGLKTWYYNLGSTSVSTGDMVEKGQEIGTCGSTGFANTNGAHIAMSVGTTFVCPYDTWEDSTRAGYVMIYGVEQ